MFRPAGFNRHCRHQTGATGCCAFFGAAWLLTQRLGGSMKHVGLTRTHTHAELPTSASTHLHTHTRTCSQPSSTFVCPAAPVVLLPPLCRHCSLRRILRAPHCQAVPGEHVWRVCVEAEGRAAHAAAKFRALLDPGCAGACHDAGVPLVRVLACMLAAPQLDKALTHTPT